MNLISNLQFLKVFTLINIFLNLLAVPRVYSTSIYSIMKNFCIEGYKKEAQSENKVINNEIGEFTCNCFINKYSQGEGFNAARDKCKVEALKKFAIKKKTK